MLKRRLIPKLQLLPSTRGGRTRMVLVTTVRFEEVLEVGDPVSQAKIYEAQAVDELIFLDLAASTGQRGPLVGVIERAAEEIFMPFTVGGGVATLGDFRELLVHGADKVSINSAALEDPTLIDRASAAYGSQCVVVAIDYRRASDGRTLVCSHRGQRRTERDVVRWAVEAVDRGAGELLLTSIDRDGTRAGLDLEVTAAVIAAVDVPVVTSGGCGLAAHFVEGFRAGADGVAAGTYFCFKDENPMQTRSQIRNAGIPIRLHR